MTITVKVKGVDYTKFISADLTVQLDAMCNSFAIVASNTKGQTFPFSLGDKVEMFVDGIKKLTGKIESFDGSYDDGSYNLNVYGRDNTADLLDSSLGKMDALLAPVSLKAVCEAVISHLGLSITVSTQTGLIIADYNSAEDLIAPAVGQSAYEFLEYLALKRNVLLSSDAEGNLLLTQSASLSSAGRLQQLIDDPTSENNIVSASFSFDNTERFNKYVCQSQLNLATLNLGGETDLASVQEQSSQVLDSEIAAGRQFAFKAERSSSSGQNLDRATWEANMRRARGINYSVEVEDHTISTDSSILWDTNTLVPVLDNLAGIRATMLIKELTYTTELSAGNITSLGLTNKDAFSLALSEPNTSQDKIGIDLGKAIGLT